MCPEDDLCFDCRYRGTELFFMDRVSFVVRHPAYGTLLISCMYLFVWFSPTQSHKRLKYHKKYQLFIHDS